MRRHIGSLLLLASLAASCGGDDDQADGPFAELVDLVPASSMDSPDAMLQYVDLDLTWVRLGVGEDRQERVDNLGRTGQAETFSIPSRLFADRAQLIDDARAEVGFDVTDINQEIAVDLPPGQLRIVRTRVEPGVIRSALDADPLWSDDLRTVEADAGAYVDWSSGDESSFDPQRITPMRPLGQAGQLAVEAAGDGSVVTRTLEASVMEEVLATVDGDQPSLADDSPLTPALDSIRDGGEQVVQAVGLIGTLRLDPVAQIDEAIAEQPVIEPYEALLLAELTKDGGYRTVLYVVYENEETAAANVDAIDRLLDDGLALSVSRPLREVLPAYAVDQDGAVVRINFADEGRGIFRQPLQALITRDFPLVAD